MRGGTLLAATMVLAISCGGSSTSAGHSPNASASVTPSANPTVESYGLLLTAGTLQMITPTGTVAASAKVAAPSVHTCGQGTGAVLQPPVSATSDKVFFRDGNTQIKYLTPDGETGNVTTVPGSATKVSFFSVSPDDQRIAVLVEDLSPATTIKLSLYVEDLTGHTNHSVIFTNTVPKLKNGTTLWPMGWHNGLLALAVWPPCTFEPAGLVPIEWHIANAVTAVRVATIGKNGCVPSYWPSPGGVACVDLPTQSAFIYEGWSGKIAETIFVEGGNGFQSGLSPSGQSVFFTPGAGIGAPPPSTKISFPGPQVVIPGHSACLWIDDRHLLAPDAVIGLSANAQGYLSLPTVTALPASGVCAGRFPGGL